MQKHAKIDAKEEGVKNMQKQEEDMQKEKFYGYIDSLKVKREKKRRDIHIQYGIPMVDYWDLTSDWNTEDNSDTEPDTEDEESISKTARRKRKRMEKKKLALLERKRLAEEGWNGWDRYFPEEDQAEHHNFLVKTKDGKLVWLPTFTPSVKEEVEEKKPRFMTPPANPPAVIELSDVTGEEAEDSEGEWDGTPYAILDGHDSDFEKAVEEALETTIAVSYGQNMPLRWNDRLGAYVNEASSDESDYSVTE